jgi:hypothetical protein
MKIVCHPLDVVTASQVARRLDLSPSRVIRAIKAGQIVPDGRAGRAYLFRSKRMEALARILETNAALAHAGVPDITLPQP